VTSRYVGTPSKIETLVVSVPPGRTGHIITTGGRTIGAAVGADQGLAETRIVAVEKLRQSESVGRHHFCDFLNAAHVGDVATVEIDAQISAWRCVAAGERLALDLPPTTDQFHVSSVRQSADSTEGGFLALETDAVWRRTVSGCSDQMKGAE
jgi:hypothetical protein